MEHLIPIEWFVDLPQGLLLLLSAIAIAVLIRGADWLVDGASGLAYRLGISKVIVGATVVSLGTTSPECAVSVMAAWRGEPGLALGNAIGSIIADTGLIFGVGCLMVVLPADRFVLSRQGWVQFGSGMFLAALIYGSWAIYGDQAKLGRPVGLLLLALLCVYMVVSVRWSKTHPEGEPFQIHEEADAEKSARRAAPWLIAIGLVGLALVLVGSHALIQSVSVLAEVHWHVPKLVIAGTLVAFGTSLPELVIGLTSILKGHKELLVGNVIGADILNVLFVVGASAAAAPLPIFEHGSTVPGIALVLHVPTMIAVLLLFRIFIASATRTGNFRRWNGWPLVALYVAYAVLQFWITRP